MPLEKSQVRKPLNNVRGNIAPTVIAPPSVFLLTFTFVRVIIPSFLGTISTDKTRLNAGISSFFALANSIASVREIEGKNKIQIKPTIKSGASFKLVSRSPSLYDTNRLVKQIVQGITLKKFREFSLVTVKFRVKIDLKYAKRQLPEKIVARKTNVK